MGEWDETNNRNGDNVRGGVRCTGVWWCGGGQFRVWGFVSLVGCRGFAEVSFLHHRASRVIFSLVDPLFIIVCYLFIVDVCYMFACFFCTIVL